MAQARQHSALKWSLALAGLWLAASAQAAQHKDPGSGCAVVAPRYLASSDYQFAYSGACKAGLAEGAGRAVWTLRLSPQNRVVWEGAFSAGVYLPAPAKGLSARAWGEENALFDLGPLPAQEGVPAPRLQVEAAADLTNYPDPCKPRTLWVVNAPANALQSDTVAQALLLAAADKLKQRCGDSLREPGRPGGERTHLSVRAVPTAELQADRWGNASGVLADASVPLAAGTPLARYSNQAASQQRQQEQRTQDQAERQATQQRLRGFFQAHQAEAWASLGDIAQNPFRHAGRVVVTMAQLDEVVSPTRALLQLRGPDWGYARAVLDGDGVAQWAAGMRVLAVRVLGRVTTDDAFKGAAQLQLVGSEACAQPRCSDWLRLPTALQDGQTP
ncbi:hypothetical protein [Pseudorhodoferax sp. Leaf274]|uniref:hypothetical protein n=1 Tax=Pseudorhodoferax sp. Leaf274 TaxID=1736318 RepID=UPI00070259D5|nr:hypothetical protein [Pseudorhodoferax sp. Leaf274]